AASGLLLRPGPRVIVLAGAGVFRPSRQGLLPCQQALAHLTDHVGVAECCTVGSAARLGAPRPNRSEHPLRPNTLRKWCRQLQAAFERAHRNAARRNCVRGVVEESKLLASNTWTQFTCIEGRSRPPPTV